MIRKRNAKEKHKNNVSFIPTDFAVFLAIVPTCLQRVPKEHDASVAVALLTSNTDLLPNKISLKGQPGVTAGLESERISSLHKHLPSVLLRNLSNDFFTVLSASQCPPLSAKHNAELTQGKDVT